LLWAQDADRQVGWERLYELYAADACLFLHSLERALTCGYLFSKQVYDLIQEPCGIDIAAGEKRARTPEISTSAWRNVASASSSSDRVSIGKIPG